MTDFYTLLSKEDGKFVGSQGKEAFFSIFRDSKQDKYGEGFSLAARHVGSKERLGIENRFVCVRE